MDTTQGDEDSLQNCNNTMKIIAPGRIKVASGSKDADGILMKSLSFQHGHHTHLSGTFFFMMRYILFIRMELTSVHYCMQGYLNMVEPRGCVSWRWP